MVSARVRFFLCVAGATPVLACTSANWISDTRALVSVRLRMQTEGTEAERPATTETSRRASGDIRHAQPATAIRWG
jgi:hypothetical protein